MAAGPEEGHGFCSRRFVHRVVVDRHAGGHLWGAFGHAQRVRGMPGCLRVSSVVSDRACAKIAAVHSRDLRRAAVGPRRTARRGCPERLPARCEPSGPSRVAGGRCSPLDRGRRRCWWARTHPRGCEGRMTGRAPPTDALPVGHAAPSTGVDSAASPPDAMPASEISAWSRRRRMLVVIEVHSLSILMAPFWIVPAAFLMASILSS